MGLTEQSPPTLFIQTRSSAIHCLSQRRKKNPFVNALEAMYSQCKVELGGGIQIRSLQLPQLQGGAVFFKPPAAW